MSKSLHFDLSLMPTAQTLCLKCAQTVIPSEPFKLDDWGCRERIHMWRRVTNWAKDWCVTQNLQEGTPQLNRESMCVG